MRKASSISSKLSIQNGLNVPGLPAKCNCGDGSRQVETFPYVPVAAFSLKMTDWSRGVGTFSPETPSSAACFAWPVSAGSIPTQPARPVKTKPNARDSYFKRICHSSVNVLGKAPQCFSDIGGNRSNQRRLPRVCAQASTRSVPQTNQISMHCKKGSITYWAIKPIQLKP